MRNRKLIDPAQKFFEQIMSGLAKNENVHVISISSLPVSASTVKKNVFRACKEEVNGVSYEYIGFINGKILRYLTVFISAFITAIRIFRKEKNRKEIIVVCDPLNVYTSKPVRLAAKIYGVKSIAVVTDIPYWATEMKQHKYSFFRHWAQKKYEMFSMKEMLAYDGYVNLTKYMNPIVNPKEKPSIVIEGSVDIDVLSNLPSSDRSCKIIMYAGGVYEKYGLGMLVNGFVKANLNEVELHIYGEGSYVERLQEIAKTSPNVKYMGVVLNTHLPLLESQATLLVNPRFTKDEYTKYSFPSKTLEYMTSGTPVLSTRLAGIPEDYESYIYWLDEENEDAMSLKLANLFNQEKNDFVEFGKVAKSFVAKNKNNVYQGKKIAFFCKNFMEL